MDGAYRTDGAVRHVRATRRQFPAAAVRGLAVSVGSTVASVAVAWSVVGLTFADSTCDTDGLACRPDAGPGILAMAFIPVVIAVAGPLMASLFRLRYPALFVLPAAWAVAVTSVWVGAPGSPDRWPFNDALSSVLILCLPYVLFVLLASWPVRDERR